MQLPSDVLAKLALAVAKTISIKSMVPFYALEHMPDRRIHARQELCHIDFTRCSSHSSCLVSLLEVHLKSPECMGVTRLQKPGELGWHNDGPDAEGQAPGQHCCRYVYPSSIQKEDGLQSS